ncbi:hypothetical protein BLX90_00960 [Rhizobium sp. Y9]|nr:hypothetical protein BLX90_00960 [Rhizobium sp. Y9]
MRRRKRNGRISFAHSQLPCLQTISHGETFGAGTEEIATVSPLRQQSIFRVLVGLDLAIPLDMSDVRTVMLGEAPGNEQAAVAFERFMLRAQERWAAASCNLQHYGNSVEERSCRGHRLIVGGTIGWTPPELVAQMQVGNADGIQSIAQLRLVEVMQARSRVGTDIQHYADVGSLDQRPEMLP